MPGRYHIRGSGRSVAVVMTLARNRWASSAWGMFIRLGSRVLGSVQPHEHVHRADTG